MKHGIIIPYYNQAAILKLNSLVRLSDKLENVVLCFVNDGKVEHIKGAISKFAHLTEHICFISVKEETTKEEAVKEAVQFLFKETDVDTIGFIDPDQSKSFSDYRVLMDSYGQTNDRILSGLKKVNAFDKHFDHSLFSDFVFRVLQGAVMLVTLFQKSKEKCVAKMFSRKVIPYVFSKNALTNHLFDSNLVTGRRLQVK